MWFEDGVAQSVEHWTANLATRVRSPVGEEPSDLICAFLHVQMESNWAGLSVCNCRHTGKWCGTIKAVGNTDHTRQTWIHMQTPLSPLAGCGPVGEGTSGKVLNWTVRSLNHAYTTTIRCDLKAMIIGITKKKKYWQKLFFWIGSAGWVNPQYWQKLTFSYILGPNSKRAETSWPKPLGVKSEKGRNLWQPNTRQNENTLFSGLEI